MPFITAATAPYWMAGVSMAGMGMSAYGQHKAGKAANKMSKYNAELAMRNAEAVEEAASEEATRLRQKGERIKARQRALFAKAGVGLEGTPFGLMVETAENIESDVWNIKRRGKVKAQTYQSQAQLDKMKGAAALDSSRWGMGSTIATGTTSAVSRLGTQKNWWT